MRILSLNKIIRHSVLPRALSLHVGFFSVCSLPQPYCGCIHFKANFNWYSFKMFKHWLVLLFGLFSTRSYRHEMYHIRKHLHGPYLLLLLQSGMAKYAKVRKGIWPRNYSSSSTSIETAKRVKCLSIQYMYIMRVYGCVSVYVCIYRFICTASILENWNTWLKDKHVVHIQKKNKKMK